MPDLRSEVSETASTNLPAPVELALTSPGQVPTHPFPYRVASDPPSALRNGKAVEAIDAAQGAVPARRRSNMLHRDSRGVCVSHQTAEGEARHRPTRTGGGQWEGWGGGLPGRTVRRGKTHNCSSELSNGMTEDGQEVRIESPKNGHTTRDQRVPAQERDERGGGLSLPLPHRNYATAARPNPWPYGGCR